MALGSNTPLRLPLHLSFRLHTTLPTVVPLPAWLLALPFIHQSKVLTYPSWCVVRGQREIPDATRAMRTRILDSFADALDGALLKLALLSSVMCFLFSFV